MPNIYSIGMICFYSLVITANIKIVIISNNFSINSILTLIFSVCCFPFIYFIVESMDSFDIYGAYSNVTNQLIKFMTLWVI